MQTKEFSFVKQFFNGLPEKISQIEEGRIISVKPETGLPPFYFRVSWSTCPFSKEKVSKVESSPSDLFIPKLVTNGLLIHSLNAYLRNNQDKVNAVKKQYGAGFVANIVQKTIEEKEFKEFPIDSDSMKSIYFQNPSPSVNEIIEVVDDDTDYAVMPLGSVENFASQLRMNVSQICSSLQVECLRPDAFFDTLIKDDETLDFEELPKILYELKVLSKGQKDLNLEFLISRFGWFPISESKFRFPIGYRYPLEVITSYLITFVFQRVRTLEVSDSNHLILLAQAEGSKKIILFSGLANILTRCLTPSDLDNLNYLDEFESRVIGPAFLKDLKAKLLSLKTLSSKECARLVDQLIKIDLVSEEEAVKMTDILRTLGLEYLPNALRTIDECLWVKRVKKKARIISSLFVDYDNVS